MIILYGNTLEGAKLQGSCFHSCRIESESPCVAVMEMETFNFCGPTAVKTVVISMADGN